MKEMDEIGRKLCVAQAELFVSSLRLAKCSSPIFLRRFMNSAVAKRMDEGGFLFESSTDVSVMEELESEYGASQYGKTKYAENELYWMGYLYRYWCYTYGKTSKQVYRMMKPTELKTLFYPYHSLDVGAAIERILEAKNIREEDFTARGVAVLRRIVARKS